MGYFMSCLGHLVHKGADYQMIYVWYNMHNARDGHQ